MIIFSLIRMVKYAITEYAVLGPNYYIGAFRIFVPLCPSVKDVNNFLFATYTWYFRYLPLRSVLFFYLSFLSFKAFIPQNAKTIFAIKLTQYAEWTLLVYFEKYLN